MKAKKILKVILGISTCGMSVVVEKVIKSANRGNKVAQASCAVALGIALMGVGGALAVAEDPVTVVEDQETIAEDPNIKASVNTVNSIMDKCDNIVDYERYGDVTGIITYKYEDVPFCDGRSVIFIDLLDTFKKLNKNGLISELPAEINVNVMAITTDQYGNSSENKIMSFYFYKSDLEKINYNNFWQDDLENLGRSFTFMNAGIKKQLGY